MMGRCTRRALLTVGLVSALLVSGWSGTMAGAADGAPTPQVLGRIADEVRDATNAPGAIVAVQRGRRPPVIVARGTRDRRDGGAIQPDDPFVIMSVSKAFTAGVVLALVARGDLDLDDRVVRYVPGWDRRITVRHLLNHRSGLPSWGNKDDPPDSPRADLENADLSRRFTMAEGLEPVRAMPLLARPGAKTHYSNANTVLLGLVIESVTGAPLADAYHRYVLDPLELPSTGYLPQEAPPRPPIPGVLYVTDTDVEIDTTQFPLESAITLGGPAASMVSDAPDLLRFATAFLRGSFPTRALAREAREIDRGGAGLGVIGFGRRGYCIFDGCNPGTKFRRIGFAGNGMGTAVRVVRDPKRDTTVLVFANSSQRGKLDPFVKQVFDRIQ
jgi:D-alanyl-D-alanine carboxypeptidase